MNFKALDADLIFRPDPEPLPSKLERARTSLQTGFDLFSGVLVDGDQDSARLVRTGKSEIVTAAFHAQRPQTVGGLNNYACALAVRRYIGRAEQHFDKARSVAEGEDAKRVEANQALLKEHAAVMRRRDEEED